MIFTQKKKILKLHAKDKKKMVFSIFCFLMLVSTYCYHVFMFLFYFIVQNTKEYDHVQLFII